MSALNGIRAQARALLPGDCFLRRDQQLRALFATDFPRGHPDLAADVKKQLMQNLHQLFYCIIRPINNPAKFFNIGISKLYKTLGCYFASSS